MSFKLADRVRESSATNGVGPVTLTGPYGGFQSFSEGIGDGNSTFYAIENGIQWEVGQGSYDGLSNTLTRDTIFDSSNNGSKIDLVGVSIVFVTLPAAVQSVNNDPSGNIAISGWAGETISNTGIAVSGWAYDTMTNKDAALSGYLEGLIYASSGSSGDTSALSGYLEGQDTAISGWVEDSLISLSGWSYNNFVSLSGWTDITIDNRDTALSGYLEDYIYNLAISVSGGGNNIALSGWADQTMTNRDNAISGWADSTMTERDSHVSGWADSTMTQRDTALSGWAAFNFNTLYSNDVSLSGYVDSRDSAISGYLEDYVDSQDHGSSAVSGWVLDSLASLSGWAESTIEEGDTAVSGWANSTIYDASGNLQSQIDQNTSDIIVLSGVLSSGNFAGSEEFDNDLIVSLSNGKSFGRYVDGDTIPSSGLTAIDVITMSVAEPINPTVSLTSSSSVDFNQVNVSINLNFSHTINTVGGSVTSASLEFRRGNSGSWTVLSTSTSTPSSFNHVFTDTAFNTSVLNYRYVIVDSAGATATATKNIQPDTYSSPSISLSVTAVAKTSPETNTSRERGNVDTNLSGSISRNENFVGLQTYTLQYRVANGTWSDLGSPVSIGPGNSAITLTNHNPVADNTATTLRYRVKVVDEFTTTFSSQKTVSLGFLAFQGPTTSTPTTSADVRGLSNRFFNSSSNSFNLNTGNTVKTFTVAIPTSQVITEVLDLDALNANITAEYINTPFSVDDAGGTPVAYNVYTMNIAVPYPSNHRHQVTKG